MSEDAGAISFAAKINPDSLSHMTRQMTSFSSKIESFMGGIGRGFIANFMPGGSKLISLFKSPFGVLGGLFSNVLKSAFSFAMNDAVAGQNIAKIQRAWGVGYFNMMQAIMPGMRKFTAEILRVVQSPQFLKFMNSLGKIIGLLLENIGHLISTLVKAGGLNMIVGFIKGIVNGIASLTKSLGNSGSTFQAFFKGLFDMAKIIGKVFYTIFSFLGRAISDFSVFLKKHPKVAGMIGGRGANLAEGLMLNYGYRKMGINKMVQLLPFGNLINFGIEALLISLPLLIHYINKLVQITPTLWKNFMVFYDKLQKFAQSFDNVFIKMINGLIYAVNAIVGGLDKIPGVSIKQIKYLNLLGADKNGLSSLGQTSQQLMSNIYKNNKDSNHHNDNSNTTNNYYNANRSLASPHPKTNHMASLSISAQGIN